MSRARPSLLDCWQVNITPAVAPAAAAAEEEEEEEEEEDIDGVAGGYESPGESIMFHNYLGVGVDAAAALRFHRTRETNPELYVSAITNKLLYGVFGAADVLQPSCAGLRRHVHVIADGVEVELPPQTQGVILLNINSYLGGVRMWDEGEARRGWWGEEGEEGRVLKNNIRERNSHEGGGGEGGEGGEGDEGEGEGSFSSSSSSSRHAPIEDEFGASCMEDGMVDVVVVYGALHLGRGP